MYSDVSFTRTHVSEQIALFTTVTNNSHLNQLLQNYAQKFIESNLHQRRFVE